MSGAVDYRPFRPNFDLTLRLGDMALYPENWEKNTVLYQLYLLKKNPLAMIIDCGVNDFVITVNRELHQQLLYFNIQHDYIERPGGHNYDYWKNALEYQMLFFHKFFQNF
jgi:enterochelin esterase-like enzyme